MTFKNEEERERERERESCLLCSLLTCTCFLSWFCFKDIVTFKNEEERERELFALFIVNMYLSFVLVLF